MTPVVDMTGVEQKSFDAVPAGEYRVAVDQTELRTSDRSGADNILWVLKVSEVIKLRDREIEIASLVGRTIIHGTSLLPQALWNLQRTLVAFGLDPEDASGELDINDEFLEQFQGREAAVTVRMRDYEGRETNNVVAMRVLTEEEAATL